jgi:hypothetical protein
VKYSASVQIKELNRATLARQMLLARETMAPARALERLVGMQAQLARPPFLGLWSRLAGFRREQLIRSVERREVVRATMMRATIHLLTARDYRSLRPALQPMLGRIMQSMLRDRAAARELPAMTSAARRFFGEEPRTFDELRVFLAERFPRVGDVRAAGYAIRLHLPLVQVPDGGRWAWPGAADFALAEEWLGERLPRDPGPRTLVLRYLAAFGPATPGDAQTWSGLQGLGEVFDDLRPKLRIFRDERGRELFDLPRAPRPPADTPAPLRFLPEYDNLLLSHADRSRVMSNERQRRIVTANGLLPTFLVDGFLAGIWKVSRKKDVAALVVEPFIALAKDVRRALVEEGEQLLRFVEEGAHSFEVRLLEKK